MKAMVVSVLMLIAGMCIGCGGDPYTKFVDDARASVESSGSVAVDEANALVCWAEPRHDDERDITVVEIVELTVLEGDSWSIRGHEYELVGGERGERLRMTINASGVLKSDGETFSLEDYGSRWVFGECEDGVLTVERFQTTGTPTSTGLYLCDRT